LLDLLNAVRVADKGALAIEKKVVAIPEVDDVIKTLDTAITATLGEKTLKDIVVSL
jgi:hypothetical protein